MKNGATGPQERGKGQCIFALCFFSIVGDEQFENTQSKSLPLPPPNTQLRGPVISVAESAGSWTSFPVDEAAAGGGRVSSEAATASSSSSIAAAAMRRERILEKRTENREDGNSVERFCFLLLSLSFFDLIFSGRGRKMSERRKGTFLFFSFSHKTKQ